MTGSNTLLKSIGNTPLIELKKINKNKNVKIFVKFEGANPGGSIKDRTALFMIEEAEKSGELTKDKIILEPTSGNTGIALAMISAVKGYKVQLTMPECVSIERRKTLEAFGAKVLLTPGKFKTDGSIEKAHEILKANTGKYYMPNQFENNANILAHYKTTGPEIFKQMNGKLNYFVTGIGTSGTIMGVGKYLREKDSNIKIVGVEPNENHAIQGLKNMNESIVPRIFNEKSLDEKVVVEDEDAFNMTRRLAQEEGLFVGISSGASVVGAMKVADMVSRSSNTVSIVTILPDRGDRYLSTKLFRSFCAKCLP